MEKRYCSIILVLLLAGFTIQGFQCGSPEFTGAKVQEQNKNYDEAIKLYEKEVQKNPANHEAWFRLGRIRGEQKNDYEGMAAAFREAEKLSSSYKNEIRIYRYQAWAEHINSGVALKKRASQDSLQLYDRAIDEYKKSEGIWPDTSLTYVFLADAYQAKGDIENAIKSQKKVWELDHDINEYKRVGKYLVQQGLEKKEQFNSANEEGLRIQKNLKEIDKGSYKSEVMKAFGAPDSQKKDKKNPKREDWKYNRYAMTLTMENEKVVGKKIEKKIDIKVDSTKYYQAMDKFNDAVTVFEEIKKVNQKDNENLNLLLQAYFESNRIKEATNTFTLAVENDPGNKMNHYILGLLYRTENNYDKAVAEMNEAIKIDPNFSDAFYDLGATYYNWGVQMKKDAQEQGSESKEYKKKFEAALPWMKKVTEVKNESKNWEVLGTIYLQLGQTKNGENALNEADKLRKQGK
jgi:tetratricopeptide (TPR) repeat protein